MTRVSQVISQIWEERGRMERMIDQVLNGRSDKMDDKEVIKVKAELRNRR
jgi:hypothetical protein